MTLEYCLKYFYSISLILFVFVSNAQVIKYNRLYSDSTPVLRNIVVSDTGYTALGGGWSSNNSSHILICFFDTSGNLVRIKRVRNQNYNLYHGYENSLIKTSDGGFALAGSKIRIGTNTVNDFFVKFNNQFDTSWTKSYFNDTLFVSYYGCLQSENNYFMVGGKEFTSGDNSVLLIKADSIGNMIWNKTYGGTQLDYGTKLVNTYDKKILLGGYTQSYQSVSPQYRGDWYLVKADSNGTKLWQNLYGNPNFNEGWVRSLINTSDSGFAIGGSVAIEYANYHARFLKLDKNLNTIIDRSYLTPSGSTVLYSIIELNSSNYITLGTETINNTKYGFLMKINSVGNIIWKRNYYASVEQNSTNYALALATTPDNGYAFTGYAYVAPNPQQMWLVKTDSLGCDGLHSCDDTTMFINASTLQDSVCFGDSVQITINFGGRSAPYTLQSTTGFLEDNIYYLDSGNDTISRIFTVLPQQENTNFNFTASVIDPWGATKTENFSFYVKHCSTSISLNNDDLFKYQIYPNPTKKIITVSNSDNKISFVYLLNVQGEILVEKTFQNIIELDMQNLSQGIYFIKIISEKGMIIRKVIKE